MIEVLSVEQMREKIKNHCVEHGGVFGKCRGIPPANGKRCWSADVPEREMRAIFSRIFDEQAERCEALNEFTKEKVMAKAESGESEPTSIEEASQTHKKLVDSALNKYEAKSDRGKLRLSMVPRGIVEAVGTIREYGTEKYGDPENWKNVSDERYWDAALRHMEAARNDMHAKDPESGYEHLWHIACNLAFIIAREELWQ